MFYVVKITSNSGNEIELDGRENTKFTNAIQKLKIWIDTVDENVNSRNSNVLNRVSLSGMINSGTKAACKSIMDWALVSSGDDVNRLVQIDIYDNNSIVRSFNLENMFVEDYSEDYEKGNGKDIGIFELKLIQEANMSDKFMNDINQL